MKKPELIVLIGLPACGKTTFSNQEKYKDYVKVSIDGVLMEMYPGHTYNEAYKKANHKEISKIFKERYFTALKEGVSIIVDKTNLTSKSRRKLLATVGKDYTKIAVVFDYDLDELKRRNEKRNKEEGKHISETIYTDMIKLYSPIKTEEGFDKVVVIKHKKI